MNPSKKQIFWKQHIEGWRNSGKSQKSYCAEQDISFSNFGYWRKRFTKPAKLIPIAVKRPAEIANLYLPSGIRIEVPVDAIAQVVSVLEGRR